MKAILVTADGCSKMIEIASPLRELRVPIRKSFPYSIGLDNVLPTFAEMVVKDRWYDLETLTRLDGLGEVAIYRERPDF